MRIAVALLLRLLTHTFLGTRPQTMFHNMKPEIPSHTRSHIYQVSDSRTEEQSYGLSLIHDIPSLHYIPNLHCVSEYHYGIPASC